MSDLRRERLYQRILLRGFTVEEVTDLLDSMAQQDIGLPGRDLARAIHRETEGNPFFVQEIILHLGESGAIFRDEQGRWVLGIYDLQTGEDRDILVYDEQLDRKEIMADHDRFRIENISWSPDSRSILLTIANIISEEDNIMEPDIYRLDLPEEFVSPLAAQYDGPAPGRDPSSPAPAVTVTSTNLETQVSQPTPGAQAQTPDFSTEDRVTALIRPQYITLAEAQETLPTEYQKYMTSANYGRIIHGID